MPTKRINDFEDTPLKSLSDKDNSSFFSKETSIFHLKIYLFLVKEEEENDMKEDKKKSISQTESSNMSLSGYNIKKENVDKFFQNDSISKRVKVSRPYDKIFLSKI